MKALRICPDIPWAGQFGQAKTTCMACLSLWWPKVWSNAQAFIRSCDTCGHTKVPQTKPFGMSIPSEIPSRPWANFTVHFIVELPESEECQTILTVVDQLIKMANFIPRSHLPTAKDTAHLLITHVVHLHGLQDHIASAWGSQFMSEF